MKKIILLSLALCFSQSSYGYEYDEKDVYHLVASGALGYLGETFIHRFNLSNTEKVVYGTIPGIAIGAYKEYVDDTVSNNNDMILNVVGALAGSIAANFVNNRYSIRVERRASSRSTHLVVGYKW